MIHDLLGLEERISPKFVRRYAELGSDARSALKQFASDVREGRFPSLEESYDDPTKSLARSNSKDLRMITINEPGELRRQIRAWRTDAQKSGGQTIGFVPTMGALHRGHLTLVEKSCELATRTVASVFVNPTQFEPDEDFESYPRDAAGDAEGLSHHGCDLLFLPSVETIYRARGTAPSWRSKDPSQGMEGEQRPGHFRGVATVVTQLFNLVQPDLAVFGDKDAQQLAVIRQLVRDLHIPVEDRGSSDDS